MKADQAFPCFTWRDTFATRLLSLVCQMSFTIFSNTSFLRYKGNIPKIATELFYILACLLI